MPSNYNLSTIDTLAEAAHQYVVSMAVADWFTITNKGDAKEYSAMAESSLRIISGGREQAESSDAEMGGDGESRGKARRSHEEARQDSKEKSPEGEERGGDSAENAREDDERAGIQQGGVALRHIQHGVCRRRHTQPTRCRHHSLHQTFDICEAGNIDRVNLLLSLAFSEVGLVMRGVTESPTARDVLSNSDPFPGEFRLMLSAGAGSEAWRIRVKEAVHEYLVARVLEGWLSVTLPEAAEFWKQLAEELRGFDGIGGEWVLRASTAIAVLRTQRGEGAGIGRSQGKRDQTGALR